jgi:sulfite reductase (NADPH) hemoprotein beta-component
MHQVVIANRLTDGIVVFLGREGRWVESLEDCQPSDESEESEALLALGLKAEAEQEVVGPDLIEVEVHADGMVPVKMREAMRARGPSIRTDLGKQAGN